MIPERLPDEIIEQILGTPASLILHLEAYKKSGLGWNEYARKIDSGMREKFRIALKEIRRNGFLDPIVDYSVDPPKLRWHQIVEQEHADNEINRKNPPVKADLCNLCEKKTCKRKHPQTQEDADNTPCCWHNNYRYMAKLKELGRLKGAT